MSSDTQAVVQDLVETALQNEDMAPLVSTQPYIVMQPQYCQPSIVVVHKQINSQPAEHVPTDTCHAYRLKSVDFGSCRMRNT